MERSNADVGVRQFVDSMLKFGLYALLIFMIATKFGVESSSVAAIMLPPVWQSVWHYKGVCRTLQEVS